LKQIIWRGSFKRIKPIQKQCDGECAEAEAEET